MIEFLEHSHRYRYPAPTFTDEFLIGICSCGATQQGRAWAYADSPDNGWQRYATPAKKRKGGAA